MRAPNYRQARKQKEQNRKLRQAEKQQRRAERANRPGPEDPVSGSGEESSPPMPDATPSE